MAVALRPAVLLITIASMLFLIDGYLDGVYPGGPHWSLDAYNGLGWTSYLFAIANLVMAVLIARGSERMLALRIGLAAFFMFERPVSAIALGAKPIESIVVHVLTAVVEAIILASTLRVWRLGHSVGDTELSLLALPSSPAPAVAAASAGAAAATVAVDLAPAPSRRGLRLPRFGRGRGGAAAAPETAEPPVAEVAEEPRTREPMAVRVPRVSRRMTVALGVLTLVLAATLVAEGLVRGVIPGVTVDIASIEWRGYLFALVLVAIAVRALRGGGFALRLLLAVALIYFLERAFTPFALRVSDPIALALHLTAAFAALALALAAAAAVRAAPRVVAEGLA